MQAWTLSWMPWSRQLLIELALTVTCVILHAELQEVEVQPGSSALLWAKSVQQHRRASAAHCTRQ